MANPLEIILKFIKQGTGAQEAEKELEGVQRATGGASSAMGGLTTALGAVGLAITAGEAIQLANAAREMGRAETDAVNSLKTAAEGIADYEQALELGRQSTMGMASDQKIAASETILFGAGLAKTATDAAQLTSAGTILSEVFKSAGASQELFVRLLSSGSVQLYNNFGLTQAMVAEKQKEIEAEGKYAGEAAKSQALKEVLIAQSIKYKGALSDESIAAAQAQTAQENFGAAFGNLINEMDKTSGATKGLIRVMDDLTTAARNLGKELAQEQAAAEASGALDKYRMAMGGITQAQIDAEHAARDTAAATAEAAEAAAQAAAEFPPVVTSLDAMFDSASRTNAALGPLTRGMIEASQVARAAAVSGVADAKEEEIAIQRLTLARQADLDAKRAAAVPIHASGELEELRTTTGDTQARITEANAAAYQQRKQDQDAADREQEAAAKKSGQALEHALKEATNNISSHLQTTFQDVFKLPDVNTDKADEPARRLATVAADGFGSEWLTKLDQQFAGADFWQPIKKAMQGGNEAELKLAATTALQNFSQGLVKDLWDVNAIKAQIRQETQAKNIRQQLTDEIAKELGAEGVAQSIGVVNIAAGNVKTAQADVATGAADMSAAVAASAPDMTKAMGEVEAGQKRIIVLYRQMIGLQDLWTDKMKAGANAFSNSLPTDAQKKGGGLSPM